MRGAFLSFGRRGKNRSWAGFTSRHMADAALRLTYSRGIPRRVRTSIVPYPLSPPTFPCPRDQRTRGFLRTRDTYVTMLHRLEISPSPAAFSEIVVSFAFHLNANVAASSLGSWARPVESQAFREMRSGAYCLSKTRRVFR
jgi:hypothetical protein